MQSSMDTLTSGIKARSGCACARAATLGRRTGAATTTTTWLLLPRPLTLATPPREAAEERTRVGTGIVMCV